MFIRELSGQREICKMSIPKTCLHIPLKVTYCCQSLCYVMNSRFVCVCVPSKMGYSHLLGFWFLFHLYNPMTTNGRVFVGGKTIMKMISPFKSVAQAGIGAKTRHDRAIATRCRSNSSHILAFIWKRKTHRISWLERQNVLIGQYNHNLSLNAT